MFFVIKAEVIGKRRFASAIRDAIKKKKVIFWMFPVEDRKKPNRQGAHLCPVLSEGWCAMTDEKQEGG